MSNEAAVGADRVDPTTLLPADTLSGICLLSYRGSIAHGMYIPSSDPSSIDDIDLMGAVIGREENYFGLREWGSRGTKEIKQGQYDIVLYEVRKFVSLLLQGNPNVLGMLWTRAEHRLLSNEWGERLVAGRGLFVGKHVYNAFAGYAHAQMEKMETRDPAELREYMAVTNELKFRGEHPNHKGQRIPFPLGADMGCDADSGESRTARQTSTEVLLQKLRSYQKKGENIGYLGEKRKQLVLEHGYDTKNAAHLIRLLRMCVEFMRTGELQVYRNDASELLQIKRGEWGLEKVKEHAAELFTLAREERDRSVLPEGPDRVGAEKMLVGVVREALRGRWI